MTAASHSQPRTVAEALRAMEPAAWTHVCSNTKDCDIGAADSVISSKGKKLWLQVKPSKVEHYTGALYTLAQVEEVAEVAAKAVPVRKTAGHCENKRQPGGCQLHNLHCAYPKCDERESPVPAPSVVADAKAVPVDEDVLLSVIERLNQNPYSLTKSECIDIISSMRAESKAPAASPEDVAAKVCEWAEGHTSCGYLETVSHGPYCEWCGGKIVSKP